MTPRAKLVVALAVVGAIPLTTGVLIWAIGSVMGIGFHGGWNGVAGTGRIIALAGLLPGLVMIVLAASGRREMMRARPRNQPAPAPAPYPPEHNLLPVAPEHQAFLADPPPPEQVPPSSMAYPSPAEPPPVERGAPPGEPPPGMAYGPPGEPPGMAYGRPGGPPGMAYGRPGGPPGMAYGPPGEPPPVERGAPPGQPPPGMAYGPSGEPYPPDHPVPPKDAGTYPPARRPWPAPGTFGTGGPSDGQPHYADPALPPYPAQPDDTYPGFPAGPGTPFTVIPEPFGTGPQPAPGHPPPGHGGPPPAGDDCPGFHRERGFPVPPQSRGEGGYRQLAAPEEWW